MRVQDLLRKKPHKIVHVLPGSPLTEAMALMAKEHVGTVLIMDGDRKLTGLISERDFVRIFTEHGAAAFDFPVCDLVRRRVITCHDDATLHDLMTLMSNNGIRHLPVIRDGEVAGMVSARDVLDAQKDVLLQVIKRQKQAFSLAMSAKEQAEESDHQKTEFLKRVSHELRTPLNAVIGFSALIESQAWGPAGDRRYVDYAAEINASGATLLGIIDEILEMTRLELGEWDPKAQSVDIGREIEDTVAQLEERAQNKPVALVVEPLPRDLTLTADRFMVQEMLGHVIGNGVKFTPAGGEIRISLDDDPAGDVSIRVRDTGRGIPEAKIKYVTKPFCCGQDAMTQNGEGIGLGLALTDAMMSVMGGALDIRSSVGKGTTVTLRFPAARRRRADPPLKRIA